MNVLIYTKCKNVFETFIYIHKNPDTLLKARQFALRFYSQKSRHFRLRNFHEFFEIGIYIYPKSMTLCVTRRFTYKNLDTLQKSRQFALRFFMYTKSLTPCVTQFFIRFLKLASIFIKKVHFALNFYMQNIMHFSLRFI